MKVICNKARRRLGIPGRPALILEPNQSVAVSEQQIEEMRKNRTVVRWLEAGVLALTDSDDTNVPEPPASDFKAKPKPMTGVKRKPAPDKDDREKVVLPEGVTGEGIEMNHLGGGWWEVWVNGFKVTDRNVRKDEAEQIAAEYE